MQSSRSRHLWLIQPPAPLPHVTPIDATGGDSIRFSPAWELLCLQSFILKRTGHTCELMDLRLSDASPSALSALSQEHTNRPRNMAIIYSTLESIGPVGALVKHIHELHPDVEITLCGPLIASFPEVVSVIPHVGFGLRGDPENILRNLLDYYDIDYRIKSLPGLILPHQPIKPPHWLPDLQALSLPEWYHISWSPYRVGHHRTTVHLEATLSRGNPGQPADRASASAGEPLRCWPLSIMARIMQKCPGHGISDVFLADSPGFWTPEQLKEWARQLNAIRNTQRWAFQCVPFDIPDETLQELSASGCRRIELIIPSVDPARGAEFGMKLSDDQLKTLLSRLKQYGIIGQLLYWVNGPGIMEREAELICHHIKQLRFPAFSVYPMPYHLDSVLHRSTLLPDPTSVLQAWITWAQHPTMDHPPMALWNGREGFKHCQSILGSIQTKMTRNPWFRLLRYWQLLKDKKGTEERRPF